MIRYLKKNFDSIAILGVFTKVISDNFTNLTIEDEMVLQALKRSSVELESASLEELAKYLLKYDEDSINGLIYNVRGILGEIEWVSMENSDGDSVVSGLFAHTNNKDYDVWCYDTLTREYWVEQHKVTKSEQDIKEWISEHPNDIIRVDEEMAEKLDLPSTGLNRDELENRVRNEINNLKDAADDDSIWDFFPFLTSISISLVVWEIYKQYKMNLIDAEKFRYLVAKVTGLKLAKIAILMTLLSIPVLNVITGASMIYRLISSGQKILD